MREGPVYAVIGTLASTEQVEAIGLPEGATIADYEAVVIIPEEVLLDAARQLLDSRQMVSPA